ncbi:agamous-like MADS-box protein AGL29 [Aegilops tauschii subsp. strangulata]|uniref:agamous-like MADS-box protein AGL29 n=1 Tax=Aegilops tauschii subsp. strangulata TaxID=200361 RepID=UPI00098AC5DA|nr:agamous-like MADS-box protein AGL29 [Aegilops tauschii subsp. strangulata]
MAPKRKGGNGRKKTVLLSIVKEDARHVCFSKRKRGLFSKTSALSLLTGAQVAAVIFSPGGKVFSFGHPSVDAVVNRFMAGDAAVVQAAADDNGLQTLQLQHGDMRTELADQKKRKKRAEEALDKERAGGDQIASWLHPDVRDMGHDDMAAFAAALLQVQAAVSGRANQVLVEAFRVDISRMLQVPPPPPPPLQLFGASTFEFGSSSSSANAGMEMQQMQMVMEMPPPPDFPAVMGMQQLVMEMPPQPRFEAAMEMTPLQEFVAGMQKVQRQGLGPNADFPY